MKIEKDLFVNALIDKENVHAGENFKSVKDLFGFKDYDEYQAVALYFIKGRDIADWEKSLTESSRSGMYADSSQARSWDERDRALYRKFIKVIKERIL